MAASKEDVFSDLPKALGFDACIYTCVERGVAMHSRGEAGFQPLQLILLQFSDAGWSLGVWGWVEPVLAIPLSSGTALSGCCLSVPRAPGACLPQGTCAQPGRHSPLPGSCPSHAFYCRRMENILNIPCSAAGGVSECFSTHFSWMCSTRGGSFVPCSSSDVPRADMSQGAACSPRTGGQCRCC